MLLVLLAALAAIATGQNNDVCNMDNQCYELDWLLQSGRSCTVQIPANKLTPQHSVPCALAVFAPVVPEFPAAPLVRAPDRVGCTAPEGEHAGVLEGAVVIATRGECTMLQKAVVAQRAGAIGIIVANNDDGNAVRMVSPKLGRNQRPEEFPTIPAVMVTRQHAKHIRALLANYSAAAPAPGGAGLSVQLQPSFESWAGFEQEASVWAKVLSSTHKAKPAAHRLLGWTLLRNGWTEDGNRAVALADELAKQVNMVDNPERRPLQLTELIPEPVTEEGEPRRPPRSMGLPDQLNMYQSLVQLYPRVCEVGFDYGVNALVTLDAGAQHYLGFDAREGMHSVASAELLRRAFGGDRFELKWGNVGESVTARVERAKRQRLGDDGRDCDLIMITGSQARKGDLETMIELAAKDHLVVMVDTPCSSDYCRGPTIAWDLAESNGTIESLHRQYFSTPGENRRSRGYSVGRFTFARASDGEGRPALTMKARGVSYEDMGMEKPPSGDEEPVVGP